MNECVIGGYSLRGTSHIANGLPKQDYVIVKRRRGLVVCVVADGLGSHRNSAIGSKCVCEAVLTAANLFRRGITGREQVFFQMVSSIWNCMIYPYSTDECGSTCLLAVRFPDGDIFIAQLGDGAIAYEYDGKIEILSVKDDDFFNLTQSIHSSQISDWKWKLFHNVREPFRLYMHTDGVNIRSDRAEDFFHAFFDEIDSRKNCSASEIIRSMLLDIDKTISDDDMSFACMTINTSRG